MTLVFHPPSQDPGYWPIETGELTEAETERANAWYAAYPDPRVMPHACWTLTWILQQMQTVDKAALSLAREIERVRGVRLAELPDDDYDRREFQGHVDYVTAAAAEKTRWMIRAQASGATPHQVHEILIAAAPPEERDGLRQDFSTIKY